MNQVRPATEIARELEQTARTWLQSLRRFSPQISKQHKTRLITLSKQTVKLIVAFLVALAIGHAAKRWRGEKTVPAPAEVFQRVQIEEEKMLEEEPSILDKVTSRLRQEADIKKAKERATLREAFKAFLLKQEGNDG